MLADQAIFTSLTRRGKSGYHLVARSPGITETEASALTAWSPSHGGLVNDALNRVSVNFHPIGGGRYAVTRTCLGRPEYSGRGGLQVYTHALIFDTARLKQSGFRPFAIFRDAMALGYFVYDPDPEPTLHAVPLSSFYPPTGDRTWTALAREVGRAAFESLVNQIDAGQPVVIPYDGDRLALAEALANRLPADSLMKASFATSLKPSSVRPYKVVLVPTKS